MPAIRYQTPFYPPAHSSPKLAENNSDNKQHQDSDDRNRNDAIRRHPTAHHSVSTTDI
jgi:hypothetical protein